MKDRIASRALLFGILVLFAMLTVPSVSAHDADAIYFLPEDISVSGCGVTETVAIWINTSVALGGGVAEFSYDSSCANVTAYAPNADWDLVNDAGFTTGNLKIGFSINGALGPGLVKIGDITINCTDCASACCGTKLVWNTTSSYIQDSGGAGVSANWVNGTFVCGEPLVVEKTVWDGSDWVDNLGPLTSDWMGKDVRFNITLTAGCLDLSNVMVFDVMAAGLQYNNSATPGEDASTAHTANWTTLGTLAAGASTSIEFNATITGYGPQDNTATATATVDDLSGLGVQASDMATVDTCPPAGINVTKKVWDGSAWVNQINGATIGNTYRFRCEVENIGSPGMDVCDITVTDVLPDGLSYADNAMLQDHHGVWWSLPDPPGINDPANNTYGWIIDNTVSGECLQVGQKIVVEYDVTVENYGLICNNITAEAYCLSATSWVQDNDSACIDVPEPDLIVSDITVNYDASGVENLAIGPESPGTRTQCNNISVNITELNGVDVESNFNVTLEINGVVQACSPMQVPAVMAGGSTVTVYCDCSFRPIAGVQYNISATADSGGAIPESDETNNTGWRNLTAITNGYKGNGWQDGRNVSALQCHEQGPINLLYSHGDSYYLSGYSNNWTQYVANWTQSDLPIPTQDSSIKKARLYVYYATDVTPGGNLSDYFTLTFNGYELPREQVFIDEKGHGDWDWTSPAGMAVYDVTHKFKVADDNIAVIDNSYTGPGYWYAKYSKYVYNTGGCMSGMLLVVVYNNTETEPDRIIWINEGYDMLYAHDDYAVSSEEATTYAEFEGCEPIPMPEVVGAKLVTVAPFAKSGDDMNRLYFNDGEWHGVWDAYVGSTNLGIAETDVRTHLKATDNTARFQSHIPDGATKGDFMSASNAFLIVTKAKQWMSAWPESDECYDVGEQFDVLVNITPLGAPIMGAQFDLHFDAGALKAETVTYGDFLTQDGWSNVFISHSDIDNANGVVSFAAARQGTPDGVTAPGTFAIVHFTAETQGSISELNLTNALASTNSTPVVTIDLVTDNGTVEVCSNAPPVPVAWSNFTYNNIAEKGLSKAYFIGTDSGDPDGILTNYRWWVDDGSSLVGEIAEHLFVVPIYWQGGSGGYYALANVTLTVTDDGMPLMDANDTMEVIVYIAGDATGDGRVNIADGVTFGMQFGKQANTGPDGLRWYDNLEGDKADLNNDGRVNIGDAMLLGTCWGHIAW